jgi:hypothetical protein
MQQTIGDQQQTIWDMQQTQEVVTMAQEVMKQAHEVMHKTQEVMNQTIAESEVANQKTMADMQQRLFFNRSDHRLPARKSFFLLNWKRQETAEHII